LSRHNVTFRNKFTLTVGISGRTKG
jgi:hypothetical protein